MKAHDFLPFVSRFRWPTQKTAFPLCIGHRGASAHATENTLQSFALAAELGSEMWELDTQLTSDGVVVVSHDDHLERVFALDRRISQLTLAELRALAPAVPTFAEVADLGRRLGCGLYVELKARGSGVICWRELQAQRQSFACFGSFDPKQVRELHDAGCDYPLSVLVRIGDDPFLQGEQAGADVLHLCWERAGARPQDLVTPALIERAFAQGQELVLWHEERPAILADIMQLPVLAICTDQPELMRPAHSQEAAVERH